MSNPVKDGPSQTGTPAGKKARASAPASASKSPRSTVSEAYSTAREKASAAYDTARERTSAAYGTARTRAAETRERAGATIEDNPVSALVGGLALGALVAALLPRSRQEIELLGGVGEKITETGKRVADAARDSARETLDGYGLNADVASDKVSGFFESATKAAATIGAAAREAMQKQR